MNYMIAVIFPVLLDAISYYAYYCSNGIIFFVSVIFNLVCVPIIFFKIFNCLFRRKNISRIFKNALLMVSVGTMLIFEVAMTCFAWGDSRIASVLVWLKAVWWIVCGFWTFLNLLYERANSKKTIIKSATCVFAALGVIFSILLNCIFEPLIAQKYGIDGLVLITLLISVTFLCMLSYLFGKIISAPRKNIKFTAWFVIVSISIFVTMALLDMLPILHVAYFAVWVFVSIGISVWYLIGTRVQMIRDGRDAY